MATVKNDGVLTIPLWISEENIVTDSLQIIKAVRPDWDELNLNHKVFTAGIMNKLVGFFQGDDRNDMVLVKVFGANTETIVDRKSEISTMKLLHEKGCGSALYAEFNNGICYECIPGSTLTFDSVKDPVIFPLVAAEMARMHSTIPLEGSDDYTQISHMWKKMKQFRDLGEEILLNNSAIKEKLEKFGMPTGWCRSSIDELESIFAKLKIPITFCHNDLLLGNIIYNKESHKVSFIDFEYAMPNYAPFDVANHFIEFAGIDPPDFSKCPTREFMSEWIKIYLHHLKVKQNIEQETFEYWVQLCFPASHLLWTLWALFQAHNSTIDYDYIGNWASIRSGGKLSFQQIELRGTSILGVREAYGAYSGTKYLKYIISATKVVRQMGGCVVMDPSLHRMLRRIPGEATTAVFIAKFTRK